MAVKILPLDEMKKQVGKELGVTDWFEMDQDRINQFADCTMDHQWIHVDEKKAAKGPFGKTIAHGYLTVSLLSYFAEDYILAPEGSAMAINYGMNKLRLISPVTVGAKIRDRITFVALEEKPLGVIVTTSHTVEIQGQEKPALFAEMLSLFYMK
jgi:acyl dehydratase